MAKGMTTHRVQLLVEFEAETLEPDIEVVAERLRQLLFVEVWPKGVRVVEVE